VISTSARAFSQAPKLQIQFPERVSNLASAFLQTAVGITGMPLFESRTPFGATIYGLTLGGNMMQ
jgi:hypothetical protein